MPLQIEENLKKDVSGIYKNELLEKFNQAASQVRFELNQGVDPVEYNKLNKLLQAIEASSEVVEQVWGQR
ncbi:MAG: EscE/YscE/SsaE family type III secretion system needle protein co-chaperone [Thiofilum sp.]|uniref:EscE/YscE/SsaE family type III secretion system needle protein co-chaperone n=1 Tax=Thiofilum sp. TaxID=2212733 RepID=UPI0025F3B811|nr:EscE/YscE/SsaE family type III secretion system needle protein co-chaperone [Thiofilum sp.]MBK8453161.1 EscE/YscE/SsaE family type III secretion system needle protein co-chaperone [Thiofilum sp.]